MLRGAREFRLLWLGQVVSALGDQLSIVAIAAGVIAAGRGATGLGVVLAGRSVGIVAFIALGGVIGDRLPRVQVMVAADVLRVAVFVVFALSAETLPLLALAGLTFAAGAGQAFFLPAYQALVPELLGADELARGNALTATAKQGATVAGPALGGVLIALSSPSAALLADAATFAVSAATLVLIGRRTAHTAHGSATRGASLATEVREGLRAVVDRPWIGLGIGMATLHLLFAIAPWLVLLPIVATEDLGGTEAYGALLALVGLGSVAGALLGARLRTQVPGVVGLLALLPAGLVLLLLIGPAPVAIVAAGVLLAGLGEGLFEVVWITAVQRDVPPALLARVFSLDYMGSLALMPVGYALTGPAVDLVGRDAVLVFGAAVVVLTTVPLLLVGQVRRLSSAPA